MNGAGTPPVLLPMASYHGTLAALRCLGAAGIPVVLAEGSRFVPAVWSRHAARRVRCPHPEDPDRFIPWLLEFGERDPGHVLCPTSDDVAFLYARYRDELRRHFVLEHPSLETTWRVLNKLRLRDEAAAVGLSMPRTWLPRTEEDFRQIEAEARFPVVIKPQTQVLLHPHSKGVTVHAPGDLRRLYAEFMASIEYRGLVLALDPEVRRPTVQEYASEASEDVYGISGYVDGEDGWFAMRASRKVLQQPRQLGVGLCFEEAEVAPDLLEKVLALCRRVGYSGILEAEFISRGGEQLLIDVNPRLYGQMAFDIARGLPQPLFAYDAALGRRDLLRQRLEAARAWTSPDKRVYCRGLELRLLLRARRFFGRMSQGECQRWWDWLAHHEACAVDAVFDPADRVPAWIEGLERLAACLRHPRGFYRELVRL